MGVEIERKFLVTSDEWKSVPTDYVSQKLVQGYFDVDGATVRVRLLPDGSGVLTLKTRTPKDSISRGEWEFDLYPDEATPIFNNFCGSRIVEKTRHKLQVGDHFWEVDVFHNYLAPLVIAEIELSSEDEEFELPSWVGEEVSHDPRYYNELLVESGYPEEGDFHLNKMRKIAFEILHRGSTLLPNCDSLSRADLSGAVKYALRRYFVQNQLPPAKALISWGSALSGQGSVDVVWE